MDRRDFLEGAGALGLASLVSGCIRLPSFREPTPERVAFMNTLHRRLAKSNRLKRSDPTRITNALSSVESTVMGLSAPEFQRYQRRVNLAYRFGNITNVQRYSPQVLAQTVLNLTNPNHDKGKPLAIFFMAEYENLLPLKMQAKPGFLTSQNSPLYGIRPLDVKPGEIDKYLEGYKVIVFETGNIWKMQEQLNQVRKLYGQKPIVAGVSIGAHGTKEGFNLGSRGNGRILVPGQVEFTFQPLSGMLTNDAIFVLPPCYSGNGGTGSNNPANAFARVHPNHNVYACDKTTIWFDTNPDNSGKIDQNSINMIGIDQNGIGDCTYIVRANKEGVLTEIPHPSMLKTFNGLINNFR